MASVNERLRLLQMEDELAGSDGEARMLAYDAILLRLEARVAEAVRAGLPPDEYKKISGLTGVIPVARKLLRLARQ